MSSTRAGDGRRGEQALERLDQLDGDLLERLAHRGQPPAARPGRPGSRRSRPPRCPGPGRQPAVAEGVQHAHGERVGGADERRSAAPRRAARARGLAAGGDGVLDPRGQAGGGQVAGVHGAGPARTPVLADEGVLAPADPGDPVVARGRAGGRWPARRRRRRRRRPTGSGACGSSHGRPNATNGARRSSSQAACGLPR